MTWKGVCIHHSATLDGATSSWEAIRRYHVDTNGWSDIGYHYGIEDVSGILRLRIGRPVHLPGAHAPALNSSHIGICIVGNYDLDLPNLARLDDLALLIADLANTYKFDISLDTIKYHRDVADKTCPGELFPPKEVLIRMIERRLLP